MDARKLSVILPWQCVPFALLLVVELLVHAVQSSTNADKHLDMGRRFLEKGQLNDALSQYHLAVESDPSNYLTYFKRATIYLALGKAKNAISDFDRVIELKPDFHSARVSRGSIYLKQCQFDLAQLDFHNVLKHDPHNTDASELLQRIHPTKERLSTAHYYFTNDDVDSAITLITEVLETCPWANHLYELRSDWHLIRGNTLEAISDLRSVSKLQPDHTAALYKLSRLQYGAALVSDSLKSIRECLRMDPDHKDCFPFYKHIKKVERFLVNAEQNFEQSQYSECIANADKVLKHEMNVGSVIYEAKRLLCSCLAKTDEADRALKVCSECIDAQPHVAEHYCERGNAYLSLEQYDDAISDYRKAQEIFPNIACGVEGQKKADARQKQSEKRDYYKILDVKRTASKRDVVRAYRRLAQKWHPDKYQQADEKTKRMAKKKFIDIAAAKEVLTDDEKRTKFDNGEDPLDPEGGAHAMPHGFQHFQQFHFQGSPFNFQFHFN